jgi:hypothetical protein
MKLLNLLRESLLLEVEKKSDPCEILGEGKQFCKNLKKILDKGTGGKGAEKLKKQAISVFQGLRNGDYISMGDKIVLEPGNKFYEDRIQDMRTLKEVLQKNNSCSAIVSAVEEDMKKLEGKGMTMRVDDQQKYSLFNRVNTHSTNQAFIISKLAQEVNKKKSYKFYQMDTFDNNQIIEEVLDLLMDPSTMKDLDDLIGRLMKDENSQKAVMDAFNFSRNKGYEIEDEGWNALTKAGFDVFPFSDDFGFIDYFGIDMVAVKDGVAYPVQVSSQMKMNPKIFNYEAPDCKVFALYKSGNKFVKYSPMD